MSDRFWTKVIKTDSCWLWTAAKNQAGYGLFHIAGTKSKNVSAHRFAYLLTKGEFDPRLKVCHTCDTPACVNPAHLFLGTQGDNISDMVRKNRGARGEGKPAAKLTNKDVIKIKQLLQEGILSQGRIAKKFGISRSVITNICHNKAWRHI